MRDKTIDVVLRHTQRVGPRLNHIVVQHAEAIRDRAVELLDRVKELEEEKIALDTCWCCKVTLEKVGPPERRVPRCTECPEPESMDDVDYRMEVG